METSRVNNKLPVAKEGLPFIFGSLILFIFFVLIDIVSLSIIFGLLCLFIIYFFRDPERIKASEEKAVMTPADGKIIRIENFDGNDNPLGEPAIKISVFMSVFNVHVNRIPINGVIKKISYHAGQFFSANLDKAAEENEKNSLMLQTEDGHKIVFIQIAGLIARRIVCWVKEEEEVIGGQRFGLIRFGSRLDIYLPMDTNITAQLNSKVKAGITVLGYLS